MNLRDIKEETEDLEASMPSEMKPSIIGEEVASQLAARREGAAVQIEVERISMV